jgi:universal stress protein A
MISLQRILFPTDLSANAEFAEHYACSLAKQFGAELHLLAVAHDTGMPAVHPDDLFVMPASSLDEVAAAMRKLLDDRPDPVWAPPASAIIRDVAKGDPSLEIIRYARSHLIDLIVMGTHGRTGLAHVFLGSVAERVVRQAPCPVLTVRPDGWQFAHA